MLTVNGVNEHQLILNVSHVVNEVRTVEHVGIHSVSCIPHIVRNNSYALDNHAVSFVVNVLTEGACSGHVLK